MQSDSCIYTILTWPSKQNVGFRKETSAALKQDCSQTEFDQRFDQTLVLDNRKLRFKGLFGIGGPCSKRVCCCLRWCIFLSFQKRKLLMYPKQSESQKLNENCRLEQLQHSQTGLAWNIFCVWETNVLLPRLQYFRQFEAGSLCVALLIKFAFQTLYTILWF